MVPAHPSCVCGTYRSAPQHLQPAALSPLLHPSLAPRCTAYLRRLQEGLSRAGGGVERQLRGADDAAAGVGVGGGVRRAGAGRGRGLSSTASSAPACSSASTAGEGEGRAPYQCSPAVLA